MLENVDGFIWRKAVTRERGFCERCNEHLVFCKMLGISELSDFWAPQEGLICLELVGFLVSSWLAVCG